jgi:energy-coupling factor transporter ATP-binding protein EcfA2
MNIDFVNRQRELDLLNAFLKKSEFSAILLKGASGIGKTYLLKHFGEIVAKDGHWVHYISASSFRGSTELSYIVAQELTSGKDIIGRNPNDWKDLIQPNSSIITDLDYLYENPSAPDIIFRLKSVLDFATQRILETQKIVIIFDEIGAATNVEKAVLFLETLLQLISKNTQIKLIFSSRQISIVDRLKTYHNLSTINLDGFSNDSIKKYISDSLSDSVSKDALDNITNKITELSFGSPLYVRLILDQAKLMGIDNILKLTDLPLSVSTSIEFSLSVIKKDQKGHLNLLKAIVVLGGSATTEMLMEFFDKNEHEISEIVNKLSSYGFLLKNKNGSIVFVHDIIQEYIIKKYIFPKEFKPTMLDFGFEEAERDHLLEKNFVFNNSLDEIFSGQKNIILGDRGAGKSSIFRFISDNKNFTIPRNKKKQYNLFSKKMLVVPCDDPTSIIQNNIVFDNPSTTPEKYKLFWLLYMFRLR